MRIEPGHVAVITGGASGIGYGLAENLVSRGVKVVLGDIREDALTAAESKLRAAGGDVFTVQTDVSNAESVQSLADATIEHFGRVDLVCNNAGVVGAVAPMWEQELGTWQWLIGIKMMGVVHGVRAFAPLLIAQGTGHILNTASHGGLKPLPAMTPYNGTMHAVVGMTETLNLELRDVAPGVGATVLCPGLVATGLVENSLQTTPQGARAALAPTGTQAPAFGVVLTPAEVAIAALAGVEADRVHVITNARSLDPIRARVTSVLDETLATA